MTLGIIIGASIVLYFVGAVWVGFLALLGGLGVWSPLLAIFWPLVIPYMWISSKVRQ